MTALTTRDALAAALEEATADRVTWDDGTEFIAVADVPAAVFAWVATLADDEAIAERFLEEWRKPYFGPEATDAVAAVRRALAAALTERGTQ